MKLTYINKDYIEVDENNYLDVINTVQSKIHLIKFNFVSPNKDIIEDCMSLYKETNRYIISDNIKLYNNVLKNTSKKYYIENMYIEKSIISFLRKNNKILINFEKLSEPIKKFLFNNLVDLLDNIEICKISLYDFETHKDIFEQWNGNIIII